MRKYSFIILLIIFLSSCMSSPGRKYYQLYLEGEEKPAEKTINKIIMIEQVKVDDLYDDFRVVYRISPFQINYYSYAFWADKPAKLIRDSLTHYFLKRQIFRKVIQEISEGIPDIVLKSKIHFIEEIDSPESWYARLSMEIEVLDFESNERLYFQQFDRREPLYAKNVALVPVVLSNILEAELNKIIEDLDRKLE